MDPQSDNSINASGLSNDEQKNYETVLESLNAYFKQKKYVIYERARFYQRYEIAGEPAKQFRALYELADKCDFTDTEEARKLVIGWWSMIRQIHIDSINNDYRAKYSELFESMGELRDYSHAIQLKKDTAPVAFLVPRRVPYSLSPKVKEELDRMVSQRVISNMEQPINWCSRLVVVPKAIKSDVRLCVDHAQLNRAVRRDYHMN